MTEFGPEICSDAEEGMAREWLETNGIGGFASSTLPCLNTRRYHGLLTAALRPPVDRYVLLSKLEETLVVNGERFELSANGYPGVVHPNGYRFLTAFRATPFPKFTYSAGGVTLVKRIFMVHGENTTVLRYEITGDASLEIRPLIAFRDYHSLTRENEALDSNLQEWSGVVSLQPYRDLPRLYFAHKGSVEKTGTWYRDFEYSHERERGLDFVEDLFQPFALHCAGSADVIVSLEPRSSDDCDALMAGEIERRAHFQGSDLQAAAEQFIVRRSGNLHTIVAGYHWFSDWGRDTMIALPGLTLTAKRYDIARDILIAFSRAENQGMLPNRFPDSGETPEYNTVDASLWFFETVRQFLEACEDYGFVREEIYATMKSIVEWHLRGTRYGIHCDTDGLLSEGDEKTQLTWMDAKIGDVAATPRFGKPVEIQALWYNALRITETLAARFGDDVFATQLAETATTAKSNFQDLFWNPHEGCLYDVVHPEGRDGSIRPNQLMAMSLGHPILEDRERAQSAITVVARDLLTPFGLRTLAPSDAAYRPACTGSPHDRDFSYHQGTVWPWLLGPYANACHRYGMPMPDLSRLLAHLREAGVGSVSEIFDGDEPHAARGCIAQAWSVSELLRILSGFYPG